MRTFHLGIVIVIVLCFACVFDYSDDVESTQLNKKSKLIPSLLNHLKFSNMENDYDFYIFTKPCQEYDELQSRCQECYILVILLL